MFSSSCVNLVSHQTDQTVEQVLHVAMKSLHHAGSTCTPMQSYEFRDTMNGLNFVLKVFGWSSRVCPILAV